MAISSVGKLVKTARGRRGQKEFAELLGVKQSSVSRYESGKCSPPIRVVEHCMRLVHVVDRDESPSAEQLADRIRTALAGPDMAQVRSALSLLVDACVFGEAQTRTTDTCGPVRRVET